MKSQDRSELEAKPLALPTMVPAPIIVVVDRGTMKGYETEQVPTRGWVPHLLKEIIFSETHGRYRDRYTDQAGAFPATGTLGYATALAERHGMETEEEIRLFRHIGEQISDFLDKHRPERWSFAAASEINPGILEHVAPEWRERLTRNIKSDLARTPVGALLQYFK
jgi:Protein required for attachment to host cells